MQEGGEVRFSLDGLVISRDSTLSIPTHLGLHHHGNEPAVRNEDASQYIITFVFPVVSKCLVVSECPVCC